MWNDADALPTRLLQHIRSNTACSSWHAAPAAAHGNVPSPNLCHTVMSKTHGSLPAPLTRPLRHVCAHGLHRPPYVARHAAGEEQHHGGRPPAPLVLRGGSHRQQLLHLPPQALDVAGSACIPKGADRWERGL